MASGLEERERKVRLKLKFFKKGVNIVPLVVRIERLLSVFLGPFTIKIYDNNPLKMSPIPKPIQNSTENEGEVFEEMRLSGWDGSSVEVWVSEPKFHKWVARNFQFRSKKHFIVGQSSYSCMIYLH